MARSVSNYTCGDDNRDHGKVFVLTEMPASQAEAWAMRAVLALMANGVELPEGFEQMGMAAMAEIGIKALSGLKWEIAKPLLDEMWDCVKIMPDPTKPHVVRDLIEQDIEEIPTRINLRVEVWKLHVGFLKAVAPSTSNGSPVTAPKKPLPSTKTFQR